MNFMQQERRDAGTEPDKYVPRRFRIPIQEGEKHPNGSMKLFRYGVYFPATDLVIGDMGGRGTGEPSGVEWIDT